MIGKGTARETQHWKLKINIDVLHDGSRQAKGLSATAVSTYSDANSSECFRFVGGCLESWYASRTKPRASRPTWIRYLCKSAHPLQITATKLWSRPSRKRIANCPYVILLTYAILFVEKTAFYHFLWPCNIKLVIVFNAISQFCLFFPFFIAAVIFKLCYCLSDNSLFFFPLLICHLRGVLRVACRSYPFT